jgi:predicted DsbA family dithiol-disulfide isomerase
MPGIGPSSGARARGSDYAWDSMTDPLIHIDLFGDPACPWDFSAEGARLRLRWRYGDAIAWEHRMVGLSSTPDEYARRGVSVTDLARGRTYIRDRFDMPIDTTPATRFAVTVVACRAVVGVRRRAPRAVDAFLRALRVAAMSTPSEVDDPATIAAAAVTAGLDPDTVAAWAAEPGTDQELARDMADARTPSPAALALRERLATTLDGTWRYTCPSYRIARGPTVLDAPGFQPARVYEVLVANLAPGLTPRPDPRDASDVLDWAPYPLATAEIAVIMESDTDAVRRQLIAAGAHVQPMANDAYWSSGPAGVPQPGGSPSTAAA